MDAFNELSFEQQIEKKSLELEFHGHNNERPQSQIYYY
jgi:hypothetical protein